MPGRHAARAVRGPRAVLRSVAALGCVAGTVLIGWAAGPAAGAATEQTATVVDSAEAWYAEGPAPVDACSSPLGCPPTQVPPSVFPADTLHVAVAAGTETARAYVVPDLTALPPGATVTGGTLMLPIATDNASGTVMPDAAKLDACLVKAAVTDGVQGSTDAPPAVDTTVCTAATYSATAEQFTVDLTEFAKAWSAGAPMLGLGLVASPHETAQTDAWHVALNGRKRTGVPHVKTVVTYQPAPPDQGIGLPNQPQLPAPVPAPPAPAAAPPPLPPMAVAPPSAPAPQLAPPAAAPASRPVAFFRGFRYPSAFLIPLPLLAGAVFLARLFTRDALPLAARERRAT